jgi:plasmid stability protein
MSPHCITELERFVADAADGLASSVTVDGLVVEHAPEAEELQLPVGPFLVTGRTEDWRSVLTREKGISQSRMAMSLLSVPSGEASASCSRCWIATDRGVAVSNRYHHFMAMTLRLTEAQAQALRARADREGRSMQQVARAALDDYLLRAEDDELTDRLAEQGAQRFADLLRRLGE